MKGISTQNMYGSSTKTVACISTTSKSSVLRQDMSSVPISHVPSVTLNPTVCDSLFNYILGICEPIISQTNTNIYKESWHLGFRSHWDTQQNRHYQIIKRTHFQGRRHEASAKEILYIIVFVIILRFCLVLPHGSRAEHTIETIQFRPAQKMLHMDA